MQNSSLPATIIQWTIQRINEYLVRKSALSYILFSSQCLPTLRNLRTIYGSAWLMNPTL